MKWALVNDASSGCVGRWNDGGCLPGRFSELAHKLRPSVLLPPLRFAHRDSPPSPTLGPVRVGTRPTSSLGRLVHGRRACVRAWARAPTERGRAGSAVPDAGVGSVKLPQGRIRCKRGESAAAPPAGLPTERSIGRLATSKVCPRQPISTATSEMSRSCALAVLSWLPAVAAFTGPATRHGVCTRPAACTQPLPRLAADHPAVAGWPDKYTGTAGGPGPRVLHDAFAVLRRPQSQKLVIELDVKNWPTWTTAGNDRWVENVTRKDKEMPYGDALGSGSGLGSGLGLGSGVRLGLYLGLGLGLGQGLGKGQGDALRWAALQPKLYTSPPAPQPPAANRWSPGPWSQP